MKPFSAILKLSTLTFVSRSVLSALGVVSSFFRWSSHVERRIPNSRAAARSEDLNAITANARRRTAGSRFAFRRLNDRPISKTTMCNYRQESLIHSLTIENTLKNL